MIAQPQINQNYKFFGGKDIARSSGATAGVLATPGILAEGEIVITDAGNFILDTTTVLNQPWIKVVMGRGATEQLWESQVFKLEDISAYVGKPYAAKVQQVAYWGYNAVTNLGSFDVINDNFYNLNISFQEMLSQESSALYNPIQVDYTSDAAATQEEVTLGLYHSLVAQLAVWSKKPVLAEMVSAAVSTGNLGATIVASKGSQTVTCTTTAGPVVGDYIRFGTADTDAVYKIETVTLNTSFTLEEPFQGEDVTLTVGNAKYILEATAQAAAFGIKATGVEQVYVLDSRPPSLVGFQIGLKDGGSTLISRYAVTGFMGFGTYQLMRDNEAASWRDQGMLYTYTEFPPTTFPTTLTSTQNYSVLNVGLKTTVESQLNSGKLPANCEIACALDGNVASTFDTNYISATGCVSVLDAFATQNPNFSAQAGNL